MRVVGNELFNSIIARSHNKKDMWKVTLFMDI